MSSVPVISDPRVFDVSSFSRPVVVNDSTSLERESKFLLYASLKSFTI